MADREKVMNALERCESYGYCEDRNCPYYENTNCLELLRKDALTLLKEYEPKKPIHIHEEYPEHDWETDKNGNIDEWALDYGFHNGPACKRCGYSFCMHCKPNGWNEKPCVIDYYQCPKCGTHISRKIPYCERCGQAVEWE